MHHRKLRHLIPLIISLILIAGVSLFLSARQTSAQCGSQASSCKNCHETQGNDPVNNDGTAWHTQHQQIDACVSCHAGNPQSTDADQSHAGMVPWNSDVKAGCFACHPDDYMPLAQEYATTLGVTLDDAGTAPSGAETQPTAVVTTTVETAPSGGGMVISEPGTIDYVQQYEETVLGESTINWGNVVVILMILGLIFGGGAFIYWNERRLRGLKGFYSPKSTEILSGTQAPIVEGYSTEVTELLPLLAKLNPVGRHALKRILTNPEGANEILHSISHLDPDLIRRVEALDKDTRALLIALAGS